MGLLSLDTLTLFLASGCNVESGFIHPLHVLVETEILALALGRPPPPQLLSPLMEALYRLVECCARWRSESMHETPARHDPDAACPPLQPQRDPVFGGAPILAGAPTFAALH